ncbi:MAG TPA: MFS transporter, partial [Paracoccaceae bacterium]
TLVMGLAMVAGNFAYGPLDRVLGTRKWLVFGGNLLAVLCLLALWAVPAAGGLTTLALLAGVGLFGATFPMIMAHGRAFFPSHLVGRGVTLLNLFGIGFIGLTQFASGRIHAALSPGTGTVSALSQTAPYAAIFLFFALALLAGGAVYAFSQDRTD